MDAWMWILLAIVVIVLFAFAFGLRGRNRRRRLAKRFGPEYDHQVETAGRKQAAADLRDREKRHDALDLRPLSPAAYDRYSAEWQRVQNEFVDRPDHAVDAAYLLVSEVMGARGYPVDDFDTQAALVSVDHPQLVENYRIAHAVSERGKQRTASTEDLRKAMLSYRSLFDELLLVEHQT